jgi:large conductance mechanosensitive channel
MAFFSFKKLAAEFRDFAFKGNMIELAVAVVIGKAFGDVIQSIVKNVIMPLVKLVSDLASHAAAHVPGATTQPGAAVLSDYTKWTVGPNSSPVLVGAVLGDLVNFVLIAAAVFFVIVKVMGALTRLSLRKKVETVVAPTTKECPFCCSTIPIKATRCGFCTSVLESAGGTAPAVSPA